MWLDKVHPFFHGLVPAVAFGLVLGAIVSIGFYADADETTPERCQDRVVALSVSNKCPKGTFLEFQSDGKGGRYIVCHCEQPVNVIIQMSPSQDESIDPDYITPEVQPAPGPITL